MIFTNETPKLAVVGAVDPQGLRALIEEAHASPGLMVVTGKERQFITNETAINRVREVADAMPLRLRGCASCGDVCRGNEQGSELKKRKLSLKSLKRGLRASCLTLSQESNALLTKQRLQG